MWEEVVLRGGYSVFTVAWSAGGAAEEFKLVLMDAICSEKWEETRT